jgi:hypothetical protein
MACTNCAVTADCSTEMNACSNDTDCMDLIDCLQPCVDDICADNCFNAHPTGANLYMTLTECAFCDACPTTCATENQGLCF